ncbi:MAG TPA: glycosyltransferase [Longimicrobiaceae bacterium]|nr:glycosyltransferase [Longimicrobiaceae bacterium]
MPFLNEGGEPRKTVESIHRTCDPGQIDIIAVDDASEGELDTLADFANVTYVRNRDRIGSAGSKHLGAALANTPFVLIIDAHMRFRHDRWCRRIVKALEREPSTAFCTVCLGLSASNMNPLLPRGRYYGADLVLASEQTADPGRPASEILEPKWARRQRGRCYDVPCILGANYAFSKQWFMSIRGLEGLRGWGTEEPFLSLKTWLAGGRCRILTDVQIGHMFRDHAPYRTPVAHLVYNKIFLCRTILPPDLAESLVRLLPRGAAFEEAMRMIEADHDTIDEARGYYRTIFSHSIHDFCRRFGVGLPGRIPPESP